MIRSNDNCIFSPADITAIEDFKIANCINNYINSEKLNIFIQDLCKDKDIRLASIAVMSHGKLVAEHYVSPYKREYRHVSYSVCKSVTQMAIGFAVNEGFIDLNEKICNIFPEYRSSLFHKKTNEITVKHLLTMSSGIKFDELRSYFTEDWCKAFLSSDILFEPGEEFAYNSLNTYMLAAIINKKTGETLEKYLDSRLFKPLHITDITWDLCPKGIEKGGWGMKLSLLDMCKLGQLFLNKGAYEVDGCMKQILPLDWVLESCDCHIKFVNHKQIKGYGYQIWVMNDGAYLFNGLFGQNVYIQPSKELVIACLAGGYEIFPDGNLNEKICNFVADDSNFKPQIIKSVAKKLTLPFKKKKEEHIRNNSIEEIAPYLNQTYSLNESISSIFPVTSQLLYSNFMKGINKLRLYIKHGVLYILLLDDEERFLLQSGYSNDEPYIYQIISFHGKEMPVAIGAHINTDSPSSKGLTISIIYLEETIDKKFELIFSDNQVKINAMDIPDMPRFLKKLKEEPFLKGAKFLDKLEQTKPLEYIFNRKLQQFLSTSSIGKIVVEDENIQI